MKNDCKCSTEFRIVVGRPDEYKRAKRDFDLGKHPTFMGRQTVSRAAQNGGLIFFRFDDKDAGIAVVNPKKNTLLALNILPEHRGHRLGRVIVSFLNCNFARVLEEKELFFRACGYKRIGELKQGRKFKTAVMVKEKLITISGRIKGIFKEGAADELDTKRPRAGGSSKLQKPIQERRIHRRDMARRAGKAARASSSKER